MDAALALRIGVDNGVPIAECEAARSLQQSELVTMLTSELVESPLFYTWRIIALSEIPYAQELEYTKKLIDRVCDKLSTPFGFSLSGDEKQFLPCYNAMLVSAMCRLGYAKNETVLRAVEWINEYQPMGRGVDVSIPGLKFDRYGGCFKSTPCYIGVAKSVFALFNHQQAMGDNSASEKLEAGIEYLLTHHLINKLHKNEPITSHILDISFPESYHLNIVELIRFAAEANLLGDTRAKAAIEHLQNVRTHESTWKVDFRYRSTGYTVFDQGRKPSEWVTHIISHALKGANRHLCHSSVG